VSTPYPITQQLPSFPPGPWDDEPNVLELTINNFECAIVRAYMGHLCGYVLIPKDHPAAPFGLYLSYDLSVHSGLTYCAETAKGIWIGFDCAHFEDLVPTRSRVDPLHWLVRGLSQYDFHPGAVYRDISYVKAQLESLTSQLNTYIPSPHTRDLSILHHAVAAAAPTLSNPATATALIEQIRNL